ncbi:MAG: DUF6586 family protein [Saccharospirillum sp.]
MSAQRGVTNRLLYQAKLMSDMADNSHQPAMQQAAREAAVLFQYQALCSAVLEVCEQYQVTPGAEVMNLSGILASLGQAHASCWEYRTLSEALNDGMHWVNRLTQAAKALVQTAPLAPRQPAQAQLIKLVDSDSEATTNRYPNFQADLQQWIDEMRLLNDQH